jgi:hypothetical protein
VLAKAIERPSGDQLGVVLTTHGGVLVSRRKCRPFARMT